MSLTDWNPQRPTTSIVIGGISLEQTRLLSDGPPDAPPAYLYGPGGKRMPGYFKLVGTEDAGPGTLLYRYRHVRPGRFHKHRRTRSMKGK